MTQKASPQPATPAERPNDDLIRQAWREVILNHRDQVEGVRPEILRSWIRCRNRDIPCREPSRHILPPDKIRALLESKSVLVQAAEPVLNMLEVSVRGTDFIVTLADKNGYVLVVKGGGRHAKDGLPQLVPHRLLPLRRSHRH